MEEKILDGRKGDIVLSSGELVGMRARDRALSVRYPDFAGQRVHLVLREAGGARRHVTESGWSSEAYWLEADRFRQDGPMLVFGLPSGIVKSIPTGTPMKVGVSAEGDAFDVLGEFDWRLHEISNLEPTEPVDQATIRRARARAASRGRGGGEAQSCVRARPRVGAAATGQRETIARKDRQGMSRQDAPVQSNSTRSASRLLPIVLLLLLFLGGAGAGAWYFFLQPEKTALTAPVEQGSPTAPVEQTSQGETATEEATENAAAPEPADEGGGVPARLGDGPADQRASVQMALDKANYDADQSFAIAEAWLADGGGTEAYLILRSLSAEGHAPSALKMGELHDPLLHDPEISPLVRADPIDAMCWYGRALATANAAGVTETAGNAMVRRDALTDFLNTQSSSEAETAISVLDDTTECLI